MLSAGADGSLAVNSLDAEASAEALYACSGAATFTAAQWTTPHTFVTATLQGALQAWDLRQPAAPTSNCRAPAGQAADPLVALAAHPAQAHVCATGTAGGAVALWDLRTGSQSARHSVEGAVAALCYDRAGGGGGGQLAFGTSRGVVGLVGARGTRELYREPTAGVEALSFSGGAGAATQLCCATDQEGLVFMANAV